jgi:hypothetical protein
MSLTASVIKPEAKQLETGICRFELSACEQLYAYSTKYSVIKEPSDLRKVIFPFEKVIKSSNYAAGFSCSASLYFVNALQSLAIAPPVRPNALT